MMYCNRCDGTGTVVGYQDQDGLIYPPIYWPGSDKEYTCPTCKGSGDVENPCPECNGEGFHDDVEGREDLDELEEYEEPDVIPCWRCGGRGAL